MDIAQSRYTGYNVQRGGDTTKRIIIVLTAILLSCTLTASHSLPPRTQPDTGQRFRIYQSFISSHPDGRDTTLRVILCTEDMGDLDQIFEEIRAFTTRMNGEDEELTIHLFRSKVDMENNNELATKIFIKDKTDSVLESSYN